MTESQPNNDQSLECEDRIERLAENFHSALQAGSPPDIWKFVSAHPDIAEPLRRRLALIERLFRAAERASSGYRQHVSAEVAKRIKCPHCGNRIQLVAPLPKEVTCGSCGSSVDVDPDATASYRANSPGSMIGRFRIGDHVGRGAFGDVYKARDTQLDRDVAIKIPRVEYFATREEEQRFLREARSAAGLRHHSIVQVHQIDHQDGLPYIVSDFIDGITLADLISGSRPSFRESAEIIATLADAVEFAHRQKVVHRDIKPGNILLSRQTKDASVSGIGLRYTPFLTDFGLARREELEITMTVDGQILGTPAYMSPEQAAGENRRVDGRTDVYSLGVVLYELLTGELPFRGTKRMLLHQVIHDDPRRPRSLNDLVPKDLETVCLKAMAKDPERRYSTAEEFGLDLRRFLNGDAIRARPAGFLERAVRWCRRAPASAGLVISIAVFIVLGTLGSAVFAVRQRSAAVQEQTLRRDVEVALATSNQRLVENYVGNGVRLMQQNDLPGSTVWFAEALKLDLGNPERERAHRIRLACVLKKCPKLVRFWSHESRVRDASFVPDSPLVFVCTGAKVVLWNYETGKRTAELIHPDDVANMSVSPDGKRIVTACADGTARIWDTGTGTELIAGLKHADYVNSAEFSPDGKLIATASEDGTARIWNADTGQPMFDPLPHEKDADVTSAQFSPDGSRLLTTSDSYDERSRLNARVWEVDTGSLIAMSPPHNDDGWSGSKWSPDGQTIASYFSSDIKGAFLWGPMGLQPNFKHLAKTHDLSDVAFSPDGRLIATASNSFAGGETDVRIFVVSTGEQLAQVLEHDSDVNHVEFSPDGGTLLSASDDGSVKIWDTSTGELLHSPFVHSLSARTAHFSQDGRLVLSCSNDGTVRIWDLATDDPESSPLVVGEPDLNSARSPDGTRYATGGWEGNLSITNLLSDSIVRIPKAHLGRINGIAFTKDGSRIITVGQDRAACVWNSETGKLTVGPLKHGNPVYDVIISPDSNVLQHNPLGGDLMLSLDIIPAKSTFGTSTQARRLRNRFR